MLLSKTKVTEGSHSIRCAGFAEWNWAGIDVNRAVKEDAVAPDVKRIEVVGSSFAAWERVYLVYLKMAKCRLRILEELPYV